MNSRIISFFLIPFFAFSQEKEKKINFQLDGSLMGQYNSFQENSSEIPATQFVFELNPKLNFYSLPLTANLRYVSGEDAYSKSMSRFNLGFDINTFKQTLMEKAMGRVSKIKEKGNLGELSNLDNISKANLQEKAITKLKAKLSTPEALESLENLKEIENLESALNNPAFKEKLEDFNSLKRKYNVKSKEDIAKLSDKIPSEQQKKLEQLYALKQKMEKLKSKKEKLMVLQKKFEKYRKMSERLKKLENPSLSSALRDPKNLKNFLKQTGGMSGAEKLLMRVERINIGKSYPFYSPYTVNRIALTGFDVSVNPGFLHLSAMGGKSQFNLFDEQGRLTMYDRQLYGGKIGFGKDRGSHFHIIVLQAKDDQGDLIQQDTVITQPQSNLVLGIDCRADMFKKKIRIACEVAASAHNTSDIAPGIDSNEVYPSETPEFIKDLFTPNYSSHIDLAYKADINMLLFSKTSDIKASYEYIGPGYISLASPVLLKDRLFYNLEWDQKLFSRQLSISFFHKQEQDNLVPWKSYRTMANSTGFGLSFYGNKGFMLQANYAPYFQSNDVASSSDSSNITTSNHMFNIVSSYNYKIGELMSNSQLALMIISGEMTPNQESIPSSSTNSRNIIFNQSITTAKGLTFNFNTSFIMYAQSNEASLSLSKPDENNLLIFDLASSFVLLKRWSNSLGIQYANENDLDNKLGFYYRTSIPIYKSIRFSLSARQSQYKDPVDKTQNYSNVFVSGGISFKY